MMFPPVVLPLGTLLVLCAILSPLLSVLKIGGEKDDGGKISGAGGSSGSKEPIAAAAAPPLHPGIRAAFARAGLALFLLTAAARLDEVSSRWGFGRSGGFGSPLPEALPPRDHPRYDEVRGALIERGSWGGPARGRGGDGIGNGDGGWALVTGASSGIGRGIAIELARRGIDVVLVGRGTDDEGRLDAAASELTSCYGVRARVVRADLSRSGGGRAVHEATAAAGLAVRYLVLCAGLGLSGQHVDLGAEGEMVEDVVGVNVESVAVMAALYGANMARLAVERNGGEDRPRMMIVSSVVATFPGLPEASLYGATRAFALSLGRALSVEMEPLGVSVTTVTPGATNTNFAKSGGLTRAKVWDFPLAVMEANDVAEGAIIAMFRGQAEYVPGIPNLAMVASFIPLLPHRLALRFGAFSWLPWPWDIAQKEITSADKSSKGLHNQFKDRYGSKRKPLVVEVVHDEM